MCNSSLASRGVIADLDRLYCRLVFQDEVQKSTRPGCRLKVRIHRYDTSLYENVVLWLLSADPTDSVRRDQVACEKVANFPVYSGYDDSQTNFAKLVVTPGLTTQKKRSVLVQLSA
jgi:hypothetical protein